MAKARNELKVGYHIYQDVKRVWAQKPLDDKKNTVRQPVIENVEETKA